MAETPLPYASPPPARRGGGLHTALIAATSAFLLLGAVMLLAVDLHNDIQWFLVVPWAVAGLTCAAMLLEARRASTLGTHTAGRRTPAAALLIFLCGLGLGALDVAGSVFGEDPHVSARVHQCQSNLREIWTGIAMYTAANGGRMPARLEDLVTAPAVGLEQRTLVCPGPKGVDGTPSYIYTGARLTAPLPQTAVVAYEPPAHHGDTGNVLFWNGTVQRLSGRQGQRMVAELEAGFNPPRNP